MNKKCFISWSGGKDSCLALYKAIEQGYEPIKLFTMFSMENGISSAHRLKERIIKKQAESIGIENVIGRSLFSDYEKIFILNIKQFKQQGIDFGIFGDIDIEEHKLWEEKVCEKASIKALLPLWQFDRKEIATSFIKLGFKAKIVVVDTSRLSTEFLGLDLDLNLLNEIEKYGADACGENGEYHTVVYDGPIFKKPIDLNYRRQVIPIGDKWAQIDIN